MDPFPHHYEVTVDADPEQHLECCGENIPALIVAPPPQFGGPGDQWTPEDLFVAAVANCFVLSFRAIAKISKFEWTSMQCSAEGKLDKVERKILFTEVTTRVKLVVPEGADVEMARKLLQKAEDTCLVSNSLSCERHLECEVEVK